MGGVSAGTKPEWGGGGAGMVSETYSLACTDRGLAINAPTALISSVLASSRNSSPRAFTPRRKTGTCKWILGERRRSAGLELIASAWQYNPSEVVPFGTYVLVRNSARNFNARALMPGAPSDLIDLSELQSSSKVGKTPSKALSMASAPSVFF